MRSTGRIVSTAAAVAVVLAGAPVWGQTPVDAAAADFSRVVGQLRAGDPVDVDLRDGTTIRGRTVDVSDSALVIAADGERRDLAADRIVRIQRRRNGILLGALVGAGAGIPFGLALRSYAYNEGGNEAAALLFPIAAGLAAGVGIDALLVRPRTVFERPAGTVRVSILGAPRRAGLQVTARF